VKLDPLSVADVATVHRIAGTSSVMNVVGAAWETQKDGRERGFFIHRDRGHYYAGDTATGTADSLPALYEKFVPVNPLKGQFGCCCLVSHTSR
jgi:hypothetical protein